MTHPRLATATGHAQALAPSDIASWRVDTRNDLPASCFCNALLRETGGWQRLQTASGPVIRLPVTAGVIWLRLRHISASGECRFLWPAYFAAHGHDATAQPLDFATLLEQVLATAALVGPLDAEQRETFQQRVLESRANTHQSLAERDDLDHLQYGPLTFAEAEQGLLAGHAFHPAPKSRAPFDAEQARRYCPEHRARVALAWWAVAPRALVSSSSRPQSAGELARELLPESLAGELPTGFTPLPMHPWQAGQLRRQPCVRAMEADCRLVWLGESETEWYPTSSHRSLYAPGAPWMVKGSLSARLTNSLRLLSEKEVTRGVRLDAWMRELDTARRFPGFAVMQEPAWLGWRNACGDTDPESLAVLRENPLADAADGETPVLATLTQQPFDQAGLSLLGARLVTLAGERAAAPGAAAPLAETARGWFAAYCERVLTPLFGLLVEDGIALLAHQQNIVLRLEDGWPVGMYYRDCQGSGVTQHFLARHFELVDAPPENLWTRETVRRYFPYYLLINSTFAVTSALAADGLIDERLLLDDLRDHLGTLRERLVGDLDCLEHVLSAPTLDAKGNFFCYLSGVNEATLSDPARLYRPLANPLVGDAGDHVPDHPLRQGALA
ncbi:IucA/IucC family protein [Halomonas sp. HP20-15]|uniref:IucA/IucC family protein n=1 Tax=Halomonas sp. HP20-15 TaxID=3085901 RepID=UPI0029819313|nr:IucA/IucC family protein [Halomonas sp. HP20-15]MDW5376388.1 IucA/IucC family protein [Halomonas sp. HP20-15]